jgi:hypothetical protein
VPVTLKKLKALRLFRRSEPLETWRQVVLWWEVRRLAYNLIVGGAGVATCLLMVGIAAFSERELGEPIGMPDPPLFGILLIVLYGMAANICYTFGWIAELCLKRLWQSRADQFGQVSFASGLAFSVILTFVPSVVCGIVVAAKLLVAHL